MIKKITLTLTLLLFGLVWAVAQTKVTGVVTSAEDGEAIADAIVRVPGTSIAVKTDLNGKFTLNNVPASAKHLLISYIGRKTVTLPVKDHMAVKLENDDKSLDEAIVVAYGTAKKSTFTGSAGTVNAKQIEQKQVSNITNALKGVVAGVQILEGSGQPGSSSTVRIRGIGSMAAGNAPLYVVDGVPYEGTLSTINPSDIESTTILKDAASAALYGARGANGVILITTKKGKRGDAVISFDAKWGHNTRGVSNYDVITDPKTHVEKTYEAIYNGYVRKTLYNNAGKPVGDRLATHAERNAYANAVLPTSAGGGLGYPIFTVPTGEKLIGLDGKLNPNATLGAFTDDSTRWIVADDWFKAFFNVATRQEYNATISGAADKVNYFVSLGYLDDNGFIENSGFTRYTTRGKIDFQAKEWLKVGVNMAYTNYTQKAPILDYSSTNPFYVANLIAPIYPVYQRNKNKEIIYDERGFTLYDFGEKTGFYNGKEIVRPFQKGSNPGAIVSLNKANYNSDFLSTRGYATLDIIDGLKFTYNIGLDIRLSHNKELNNPFYGQFKEIGGNIYASSGRTFGLNQQALFTYNKSFGDHNFDVTAGYESYKRTVSSLSGSKDKLFNPNVIELNNAILNPSASSSSASYATMGYLARIQYDYEGKYLGGVSYRRDASSHFAPHKRWGNFGSVSGAWVLSKEYFLKPVEWINHLKLKASYGVQGNDNLLYYDKNPNYLPYEDQYVLTNNSNDFAISLSYKGNRDLTWESSHNYNIGVDFALFNNRLTGSIEYFGRKTSDMLYYLPVNPSLGYDRLPINVGSILNSGIELDLNYNLLKTDKVEWNVYGNATSVKNKILSLHESTPVDGLVDGARIYVVGESMYQLYIRNYAGVAQEDYIYTKADGTSQPIKAGEATYYRTRNITNPVTGKTESVTDKVNYGDASRYKTGDLLPTVYGGFGTSVNAYGFDLSVSFAYQLGGRTRDLIYSNLMHGGTAGNAGTAWHKDILNSWTPENKSDIPQVNTQGQNANSLSDRFLISSNYLDFSNITLGYTLPEKLTKQAKIASARIYLAADNVALFSARKGLDPRGGFISSSNDSYNPIRTISGGIKLTF